MNAMMDSFAETIRALRPGRKQQPRRGDRIVPRESFDRNAGVRSDFVRAGEVESLEPLLLIVFMVSFLTFSNLIFPIYTVNKQTCLRTTPRI